MRCDCLRKARTFSIWARRARGQVRVPADTDAAVSAEEEQARLLPVLEGILKARPDAVLSVDTYKAETARAALQAGAEIVNDVSGFTWDRGDRGGVRGARGGSGADAHARAARGVAQAAAAGTRCAAGLVRDGLAASMEQRKRPEWQRISIVLDPGYGFGKRFGENYVLLARQAELLALGRPLLAGLSRKSFLGHTLAPFFGGKRCAIGCARKREPGSHDGGNSARSVDCARACGARRRWRRRGLRMRLLPHRKSAKAIRMTAG